MQTSGYNLSLNECPNPDCNCLPYKFPAYIQNQLLITLRQFYAEYYEGMMECENPTCSNTTNEICLNDNTNPFCDKCRICHMHRIVMLKLEKILFQFFFFEKSWFNFGFFIFSTRKWSFITRCATFWTCSTLIPKVWNVSLDFRVIQNNLFAFI